MHTPYHTDTDTDTDTDTAQLELELHFERIHMVFCLCPSETDTGAERPYADILPYDAVTHEGVPSYMPQPLDLWTEGVDYLTVIMDCFFGVPEIPGWKVVETFLSSGETQCSCVDCDDTDTNTCPLCDGDGIAYLGDGWAELVFRRDWAEYNGPGYYTVEGMPGSVCVVEVTSEADYRALFGSEGDDWYGDDDNGFYWYAGFPGCLPDSDVSGPYDTGREALVDAFEGVMY